MTQRAQRALELTKLSDDYSDLRQRVAAADLVIDRARDFKLALCIGQRLAGVAQLIVREAQQFQHPAQPSLIVDRLKASARLLQPRQRRIIRLCARHQRAERARAIGHSVGGHQPLRPAPARGDRHPRRAAIRR